MALKIKSFAVDPRAQIVYPTQFESDLWIALPADRVDTQDASTITDPASELLYSSVFDSARLVDFGDGSGDRRERRLGTNMALILAYDDGLTGVTDPVIKLFGRRKGGDTRWRVLRNLLDSLTITLETASSDLDQDGTPQGGSEVAGLKYTVPSRSQMCDMQGCSEFIIGVETALAGTGTTSTAHVLAYTF